MRILSTLMLSAVSLSLFANQPATLDQAIERIQTDLPANRVLNQLQAATIALDSGQQESAATLFDQALTGITAVYADSEQAAAARSLWHNEGSKDYKGEPYERAMAFYYRGLLDMFAADYENARASFKSALLQDAFAEEAQYQADFALVMFLEGWSSQMLGANALAAESYAELQSLRPDFPIPAADHNLLVIAESGKAPRKLQDGVAGNMLVYRPGRRITEQRAQLLLNGQRTPLHPAENIFWQASTRGGRPIDHIIDGQVQFKQGTEQLAVNTTNVTSALSMLGAGHPALAGIASVAGVASMVSSQVRTRADNRFWNNLPDQVHVHTLRLPPGQRELHIEYLDAQGMVIPELSQTGQIQLDAQGRGVVWVRARRATDVDSR